MRLTPFLGLALAGFVLTSSVAAQEAAMAAPTTGTRAPAALRGAGPNGATLKCRDGSHPAANAPASACDGKGGVLLRYPVIRIPSAVASAPAVVRAPDAPRPAAPSRQPSLQATPPRTVPTGAPPADATMICRDGTMVRRDTTTAACQGRGGIALRFRPRPT